MQLERGDAFSSLNPRSSGFRRMPGREDFFILGEEMGDRTSCAMDLRTSEPYSGAAQLLALERHHDLFSREKENEIHDGLPHLRSGVDEKLFAAKVSQLVVAHEQNPFKLPAMERDEVHAHAVRVTPPVLLAALTVEPPLHLMEQVWNGQASAVAATEDQSSVDRCICPPCVIL